MKESIDNILAEDDKLTPSASFVENVMAEVHEEATALPPVRFPWVRALPGVIAFFIAMGMLLLETAGDPEALTLLMQTLDEVAIVASELKLQWIILALSISACAQTSIHLLWSSGPRLVSR